MTAKIECGHTADTATTSPPVSGKEFANACLRLAKTLPSAAPFLSRTTTVVLMEHGDDPALADAAAVPDAELLPSGTNQEVAAALTEAADDTIKTMGYAGIKRYVRLTITPTGNAAGTINIAVLAVGRKRVAGATN